ncbi:uncharacterized protein BX663DRAFT_69582 [Cokeromyces recurvatus]|uniref:uncharacterized protein n=1 Tax=Cokeromyces recurvatus TaxID=90255 RepID=UPI00221FBA11|nr:uncharacterized protein BX663DRAFT_69582 [Cokeromyces recurvatus]KAI7902784.1 hypothetical protein BX663DRAFT_69582 [Cokeromyces recurvatus]
MAFSSIQHLSCSAWTKTVLGIHISFIRAATSSKWYGGSHKDILNPAGTYCNHWPDGESATSLSLRWLFLSIQHLSCSAWTRTVLDIAHRKHHLSIQNEIQVT